MNLLICSNPNVIIDTMSKMETFSFRLPPDAIAHANIIAAQEHIPLRTLLRSWIMQRIDQETSVVIGRDVESAADYNEQANQFNGGPTNGN